MKRIAFVNYYNLDDISLPDLLGISSSLGLSGSEIDIYVIGNCPNEDSRDNVNVYVIELKSKNKLLRKLEFCLKVAKLVERKKYDVVHAYYTTLIFFLPFFTKKFSCFILDIRSVAVQGGLSSKLRNTLCAIESQFFSGVFLINKKSLPVFPFLKHPVYELPVGVDPEKFKPITFKERNELKKESKYSEKAVFIYVGSLDRNRKLENLITVANTIVTVYERKDFVFLFLGDGSGREYLESLVSDLNLATFIEFVGKVPYSEVHNYLSRSDIALSYVPNNDIYQFQPPLKTLEYLRNGIPQVATDTWGNRAFITDNINGLLSSDVPDKYAARLFYLMSHPELQKQISENTQVGIDKYYWKNIAFDIVIPAYLEIINEH